LHASVVREGGDGFAGPGVGCPAEVDAAGLARGFGNRGDAAFGAGLVDCVDAVEDRTDLGEQLGQVDGADARERGQQLGSGVLVDALPDQIFQIGNGGLDAAQQRDLGFDHQCQGVGGQLGGRNGSGV
jgi:hypothetical protein